MFLFCAASKLENPWVVKKKDIDKILVSFEADKIIE